MDCPPRKVAVVERRRLVEVIIINIIFSSVTSFD